MRAVSASGLRAIGSCCQATVCSQFTIAQKCLSTSAVRRKDTDSDEEKSAAAAKGGGGGGGFLSRILTGQKTQDGSVSASHSSLLSDKDVVYELATHNIVGGEMDNYVKHYCDYVKTVEARGNASLAFSGRVMFGNEDQAVHLWKYQDSWAGVDRHMRDQISDKALQEAKRDESKFCSKRKNALMLSFSFWGAPQPRDPSHIYDLRSYILRPGTMIEWGNTWAKGITYRRDFNQDVGGFFTQVGRLYMVFHLWAYDDMAARKKIREHTWSKPGWDTTVQYTVPLIRRMRSRILVPNPCSPMQ